MSETRLKRMPGPARTWRSRAARIALVALLPAALLALATAASLRNFPDTLESLSGGPVKSQVLARDGTALSYTLENSWNLTDTVGLTDMPPLLQTAFIAAEDQHFYEHHGVDWPARFAALWLNLRHGAALRGASSISEQVVRMIHPRPRTLWSRWVEGFEARRLEMRFSKTQILSFYLNQVPYAERRRGVVQAARLYFDRGLDTLSPGEQLALAVLVRSPVGMDLRRNPARARRAQEQLANRLERRGDLTSDQRAQIRAIPWVLNDRDRTLEASHFVSHALAVSRLGPSGAIVRTTLDPHLQIAAQTILDGSLRDLAKRHVHDAAMLIIDHRRNEILGWVVSRADSSGTAPGYDTVLTPRQPGSTMKPLLYALALEKGWTAATLINDEELSESIGGGQHTFQNYSRRHYGPLRVREALGNSLNIPAVKTLKFVGQDDFMDRLHRIGITSLTQHAEFYGDGLALGNGEISLYEMAQAYTVLARQGRYLPLTLQAAPVTTSSGEPIFAPGVASLIGNILSDPEARMLEFGRGLQFPVDTAIKTGTSTDYRDAWAIAFDYRHTVAVWMGNLDGSPTYGITGAIGPALALRAIFSKLNKDQETLPLPRSPDLISARICRHTGLLADAECESTTEWFLPGTLPSHPGRDAHSLAPQYRLLQPTPGLQVAHDPRIPAEFEALPMEVAPLENLRQVTWYVDGQLAASTTGNRYPWPLARGGHTVRAQILTETAHDTDEVRFYVH